MSYGVATRGVGKGLVMLMLSVLIFGGLVFVGWRVGWWFRTENTQREDQLYDNSYGRQSALKDQVTKNVALVFAITVQIEQAHDDPASQAALAAQREAVGQQVCADAVRINPSNYLRGPQALFVETNCDGGSLKPSSAYAH